MRAAASVVTVAAVLSGCSGSTGAAPAAHPTSVASSVTAVAPTHRIPDGTYSTVVTRHEEVAKGFARPFVDSMIGKDGRIPVTIKLAGASWSLFDVLDDGSVDHGDQGVVRYTPSGDLVLDSTSVGCPHCVVTYRWRLTGDMLTLVFVSETGKASTDYRQERLMTEHSYRRTA